jgi:hypothetical protein
VRVGGGRHVCARRRLRMWCAFACAGAGAGAWVGVFRNIGARERGGERGRAGVVGGQVCFWLKQQKFKVMLAACDTFRSGAVEQVSFAVE